MKVYSHNCELMPLSGDGPQGIIQLCGLLDRKGEEGHECIAILPLQMANPTMGRNGLLQARPQPAFAVIFRQEKQVENGQLLLDGGEGERSP